MRHMQICKNVAEYVKICKNTKNKYENFNIYISP